MVCPFRIASVEAKSSPVLLVMKVLYRFLKPSFGLL